MAPEHRYLAFISYKREDERWAKWLQNRLEHYKLPLSVRRSDPTLPEKVRPVFRDTTDLSGGVLEQAIQQALDSSKYLIVICSPRAAQSPWVCKEVQEFIDSGREQYIIPFIIDGEPNSKDGAVECFPENLRKLSGSRELLGININEMGRDAAAIKTVARMFNLQFDSLWQRYNREKKTKRRLLYIGVFVFIIISLFVWVSFYTKNTHLKKNHGLAIAGEAERLIEKSDYQTALLLLLEVSPENNYPYVPKVERVVRTAIDSINFAKRRSFCDYYADRDDGKILFSPNGKFVIIPHNDYAQQGTLQECINTETGKKVAIKGRVRRFVNDSLCYASFNDNYTGLLQYSNEDFWKAKVISGIEASGEISSDLQTMVSLRKDTVEIIDLKHGRQKRFTSIKGDLDGVQFNKAGDRFFFISRNHEESVYMCHVYNLSTHTIEMSHPMISISKLKWLSNSKIICYDLLSNSLSILDVDNLKTTMINLNGWHISCLEVIPNEEKFVLSPIDYDSKGRLYYYDAHGNIVNSLYVSEELVNGIGIKGDTIAVGDDAGEIFIFNKKKSKMIGSYKSHTEPIEQICFSPDGKYLVSSSYDGTAVVTDIEPKRHQSYEINKYSMVAFSPDDKLLIAGSEYGIKVFDLESGTHRRLSAKRNKENDEFTSIESIAICNDCKHVAMVSNVIKNSVEFCSYIHLWDLETGNYQYVRLKKQAGTCAFTPDGRYLSVSTFSHLLYLRDLKTNEEKYVEIKGRNDIDGSYVIDNNQISIFWVDHYKTFAQIIFNNKLKPKGKSPNLAVSMVDDCPYLPIRLPYKYRVEKRYVNGENYFAICDAFTGKEVYYIKDNDYRTIVFNTAGNKIAAYDNEKCEIYDFMEYNALLKEAKNILQGRELTDVERKIYFSE